MTTERWIPVPGYQGLYEVSDLGRVRNVTPRYGDGVLRGTVDQDGYLHVRLSKNGGNRRFRVHRVVCTAFHGCPPPKHECGHKNGKRQDNKADNLYWITRSQNTLDSVRHGTFVPVPGRTSSGMLPQERIDAIRADAEAGLSGRAIARKYGISHGYAHKIAANKRRQREWPNV